MADEMRFEKYADQGGRPTFRLVLEQPDEEAEDENATVVTVLAEGHSYVPGLDVDATIKEVKSGASGAKVVEPVEGTALDVSEIAEAEAEAEAAAKAQKDAEKKSSTTSTGTTVTSSASSKK